MEILGYTGYKRKEGVTDRLLDVQALTGKFWSSRSKMNGSGKRGETGSEING